MDVDFIIIGAGAAGCVLADRLSESGKHSVLVIEAGGGNNKPLIQIPAGFYYLLRDPAVDWGYHTSPEPGLDGRQIKYPRGKVLGGSGSINGLWQSRGITGDYDAWQSFGGSEWSDTGLLPYFRKSENYIGTPSNDLRGHEGPIKVTPSQVHALTQKFLEGGQRLQLPLLPDYNASPGAGVATVQQTRKGRFRETAATSYLRRSLRRKNVTLVKHAHVLEITLQDRVATGVRYQRSGGPIEHVVARREVILSAGAINSPQLLQLSGIGPARTLQAAGVRPVVDLPGVGQNLHDHFTARVVGRLNDGVTLNQSSKGLRLLAQLFRYLVFGDGILTYSAANGTGFTRSSPSEAIPDLQFVFSPASYSPEGGGRLDAFPAVTCGTWLMRPKSRGELKISSSDPYAAPTFTLGYLSEEDDQARMIAGLRFCRRLLSSAFGSEMHEIRPGPDAEDEVSLLSYMKQTGSTVFHPVGSCRFGRDPGAVVDPELKVHGVRGLRVVDASVMPTIPSSNTHAPVVAIAEKAADLILQA